MIFKSKTVNDTYHLAKLLATYLPMGSIVLLDGDLGAGNTTFVKGFALAKGIQENITSPTFTILKTYSFSPQNLLVHIDAYRLENSSFDELEEFVHPDNLLFIEWSNYLKNQELIQENLSIHIRYLSKNQREFSFIAHGKQYQDVLKKVFANV